jgi:hypothetical protein
MAWQHGLQSRLELYEQYRGGEGLHSESDESRVEAIATNPSPIPILELTRIFRIG